MEEKQESKSEAEKEKRQLKDAVVKVKTLTQPCLQTSAASPLLTRALTVDEEFAGVASSVHSLQHQRV